MSEAATKEAPRRRPAKAVVEEAPAVASPPAEPPPVAITKSRKSAEWEIEQRRKDVFKQRMRGLTYQQIADNLSISVFTVRNDLEALRKENKKQTDEFQQSMFVGEVMEALDDVIRRAWEDYERMPVGAKDRAPVLDLIRKTHLDKLKALTDVGLVQKVADKVQHSHTLELPWTEDLRDNVIKQMLNQSLKPQLALPTPDPDHAPGKQIQEAELVNAEPAGGMDAVADEAIAAQEERLYRSLVAHGLPEAEARKIIDDSKAKLDKLVKAVTAEAVAAATEKLP